MSSIGKAPSTEGRIQWKESTLTDYKRVLWGNTPKDRAELADLERKGVEYTGLGTAKKAGHNPPKLFELDYYDGTVAG